MRAAPDRSPSLPRSDKGNREVISISSGPTRATICRRGAELIELTHRDFGDLLWTIDPQFWSRTSPILFPSIGPAGGGSMRVGAHTYHMPQHGFAHSLPYDIMATSADRCRFRLCSSAITKAHYPFAFCLDVSYAIMDETLVIEAEVANSGDEVLAASFGFHPGFRWPLQPDIAKTSYSLQFPHDAFLSVQSSASDRSQSIVRSVSLQRGLLKLDESLFESGALVIREPSSEHVILHADGAACGIKVGWAGISNLALWMKPGADFLCIEPWYGLPEPVDFSGDLFERPGVFVLAPQGRRRFTMSISVTSQSGERP